MNRLTFILRSLTHHARLNLAVALGVMAGVAVLTGALVVGASVRGSLRGLSLERLGPVDEALVSSNFFRQELPAELASSPGFADYFSAAVPAIVLEVNLERPHESDPAQASRASRVALYGTDEVFWQSFGDANLAPKSDEIVLNAPVAEALQAKVGDEIVLRIPEISEVSRDSALGKKNDTVRARRVKLARIIPAEGVGRFGLRPDQQTPRIAYMALRQLQTALDQYDRKTKTGRVNAIFVMGRPGQLPTAAAHAALIERFHPQLGDYGLSLASVEIPGGAGTYLNVASKRMLLEPSVATAVAKTFPDAMRQPALTYLANTIAVKDKETPYSTITAIDLVGDSPLGPVLDLAGQPIAKLADDEIVLIDWAAEDLEAKPGDEVVVTYFEPESTHGEAHEATARFRLKDVCRIAGPAADRLLTPDFPGVTDKLRIGEWDPPFPYDSSRIRGKDEDYWRDHRATPKAYISLAAGQKLWGSRFGQLTSIRVASPTPPSAETLAADAQRLTAELDPVVLGLAMQPVKGLGLAAAAGTTPFDLLFLGFSFFIIAAAVMLVALLFRLGVDTRAAEVGVMLAQGLPLRLVQRLLSREGLLVAALGGLAGVGLGIGYAALMLAALSSPNWWLAAVSTPFLKLHVTPASLAIGYFGGVLISYLAIRSSVRRLSRSSVRRLMSEETGDEDAAGAGVSPWTLPIAGGSLALAVVLAVAAFWLQAEAQAGAFLGSGALVLTALLALLIRGLKLTDHGSAVFAGRATLARFALRNGARNPLRSTLTVGLVASATFLIVAISAFRIDTSTLRPTLDSGNGGFVLVGQSDQPIYYDLNGFDTPEGRRNFTLSEADSASLAGMRAFALRVRPGDDASCRNLYQTGSSEPRVLGVPEAMIDRGGFAWAGTLAETPAERANPWLLLRREGGPATLPGVTLPRVPIFLDAATAQYSLKVGLGGELPSHDELGAPISLWVVGLLKNSLLQGDVIMSEAAFRRHYPRQTGYRFFLIQAPAERTAQISRTLESAQALSDLGFSLERANDRLASYLAVQNTYLSTFQSLGGLGLLLGTFGLATVQLRSVLERRGELALLRATGLRRGTLAMLVMLENASLLVGGLAVGSLAALVAVLPHLLAGGAAVPWSTLAWMLGLVLGVGLLAGLGAVRAALNTPLLPALRGD